MTKRMVLLVDDEADLIDTMSYRLEAAGYRVESAMDGASAVIKAEELKPELIIMDVMMPDVDGFEALSRLKKNAVTKKIPVIIFSCGKEEEGWAKRALTLGAAGYVVKPFEGDSLLFTVEKFIKAKKERE